MPERTNSRRALSHVGGQVQFSGQSDLARPLQKALAVTSDERQTRRHIHGFHSYPARLHPVTARTLIAALSSAESRVLDPFCGSGTVVVEARLLGRAVLGRDLNPLAVALTKLKSGDSTEAERSAWIRACEHVVNEAEHRRRQKERPSQLYPKEDLELFEIHVLLELDNLKLAVRALPEAATRRVLMLALSSVLTKLSRRHGDSSRKSSERRLPAGFAARIFRDRVHELTEQLASFERSLPERSKQPDVRKDDARLLRSVPNASVDLIVTSPPYPGVYDYFDHHAARLRWLGMDPRGLQHGEIGSRRQLNTLATRAAISTWEADWEQTLQALGRVLRQGGLAAVVMADTAVAGAVIRGDETTLRIAKKVGLSWVATASQQRPQFHFESTKTFGGSLRREHLIVLRRS